MTQELEDAFYLVRLEAELARAELDRDRAMIDSQSWRVVALAFGAAVVAMIVIAILASAPMPLACRN